ncbi:MAG: hypothetical protein ACTHZN_06365 [Canibacter sp.]
MVTRAFRIRVALLGSGLRGSALRAVGLIVGIILGLAAAIALAYVPELLSAGDIGVRNQYDIVLTSAVSIAAVLTAFFAGKGHVEARAFTPFPVTSGQVATGIWLTGWCTWSMLGVLAWLVARAVFRAEWWDLPWAVIVGSILTYVVIITSVRAASGLSRLVFVNGVGAAIRRVVFVLFVVATLPLAVFGVTSIIRNNDGGLRDASTVLSWLPAGSATEGILAAGSEVAPVLARWGATAGWIVLFAVLWYLLASISMRTIPAPDRSRLARSGLGWFEYFSDRPAQVIAARTLTYWRRDPRYGVGLWALPIAPTFMVAALLIAGMDWQIVVLLPLPIMLFLLGWSIHNDVAMDSTAIWLHITSGTRGRDDRIGRLAPVALIGVPLLLLGSSITSTIVGDWQLFPAVLGLNIAVLLISSGVSSMVSARWSYPSTRPGDSPFQQPQWSGSGSGFAQTLSVLAAVVLSLPALFAAIIAMQEPHDFIEVMTACLVGVGSGIVVLVASVFIGGRVFDRSGPEILAVTEVYD